MSNQPTAEQIAHRVLDLGLVDNAQMQGAWDDLDRRDVSGEELLQVMVRRDLLTNWQVERVVKGETAGFFYGEQKVLYMVGAGTFSRVYRAAHKHTNEIVAVKVLRNRHSDNPQMIEQFEHEAEMGQKLRHPNIVPVYEAGSLRGTYWMVMEFVEGNTLRDFIRIRKKLDSVEATQIMIDLCAGIRYAAKLNISHKDLKASNVLISSQGQPKLIDFGLAAVKGGSAKEQRTVDYAGLEKASGAPKNDPRSDLYFLGCIYYHMLCGETPLLETRDRTERVAKQRFLDVTPIQIMESGVPAPVAAIVNRAMDLNPQHRYQNPAEMLVELKRAAEKIAGKASEGEASETAAAVMNGKTVMFVESNVEMQNAVRAGLKRSGYRVLVTSSPDRAMDRFEKDGKVADCVIFSTGSIGREGIEAFNTLAGTEKTKHLPAILLLDNAQLAWRDEADLAEHRVLLPLPIKLKQLRMALAKLMPSQENSETENSQPAV